MPRVILPGGGGGKMRVRYTAKKLALVAASKHMIVEGKTLRAAASELRVTDSQKRKENLRIIAYSEPAGHSLSPLTSHCHLIASHPPVPFPPLCRITVTIHQ